MLRYGELMQTVSRSRFIASLTLFSVGWLLMLLQNPLLGLVIPACFTLAFVVRLSPAERQRQIPPRELLLMGAFLLAFVLVMVAAKVWMPEATNERIEAVLRSPWFVIPTWIASVSLILFVWKKRQRAALNGEQAVPDPLS